MSNNKSKSKANGSKKATQGKGPKQQKKNSGTKATIPVAMSRNTKNTKPVIRSLPNGNCTIRHREYLFDLVSGSGTPSVFTTTTTPINPGVQASFPWLAQIAQRFEKYFFRKLHFVYEPQAPSTLGGTVIISLDYDATDSAPLSKQQAMAYKNAIRCSPWNECKHVSAHEDLSQQKQYFVRSGPVPANSDVKLYDTGTAFVCSAAVATPATSLGELYVEYEIDLLTPVLTSFTLIGGSFSSGGTQSNAAPMGTVPVSDAQNVGITLDSNSLLTFSGQGDFSVQFFLAGTTITGLTGITGSGIIVLSSNLIISASATSAQLVYILRISNTVGATVDFGATAAAYGPSSINVSQAPFGSFT